MPADQTLEQEVASLGDLPREELAERWKQIYGCPPPKGARYDFLLRAAAWHLQAKRLGGLRPETRRLLKVAMARAERELGRKTSSRNVGEVAAEQPVGKARQRLSPGARLIRDWNGRTHVVDVLEEGFAFEGRLHKSLTAIARQITGAHWSGPRFFGL